LEVFNGQTDLFWEDAWKQLTKLESPDFLAMQRRYQEQGKITMNHYWKPNTTNQAWKQWIFNNTLQPEERDNNMIVLQIELAKRKIRNAYDVDQLHWGKLEGGTFSLKEARACIEERDQGEKVNWYKILWDAELWLKIKTFLWLLMHRRTLTWENLWKKGFIGPSCCPPVWK